VSERAPIRIARGREGKNRSVVARLQSASAPRLARRPDPERVRCAKSEIADPSKPPPFLVENCLAMGPTSHPRAVYLRGGYVTGKLTRRHQEPPRGRHES